MGVFIDYVLYAECSETELVRRLERVRQRCLDLPLQSVGQVTKVEAIHNPIVFQFLKNGGHTVPPVVARRLKVARKEPLHGEQCLCFSLLSGKELSEEQRDRYLAPAEAHVTSPTLWNQNDLPEEVTSPPIGKHVSWRFERGAIALEYASVLLRYGYLLLINPSERCETVSFALSTYDQPDPDNPAKLQMWYGDGFTKTQYAKPFIHIHETICRVLDTVQEEGLLLSGSDTCGYYATRTWEEASKNVNEELAFAKVASGLIDLAVGNLREEGVQVTDLVNNAGKAELVDFSSVLEPTVRKTKKKNADHQNDSD